MKLRKLARLCEHDRLEPHYWMRYEHGVSAVGFDCPGGVFLPDDTLPRVLYETNGYLRAGKWEKMFPSQQAEWIERADAVLDALSVREAPEVDKNQLEVPFKNDAGLW